MTVTTLHEVEESLRRMDPDTLREMVFQAAHSHITICELTSRVGGCSHVEADETRDRVNSLTIAQIAAILAPTVWMSIDLHQRIGSRT